MGFSLFFCTEVQSSSLKAVQTVFGVFFKVEMNFTATWLNLRSKRWACSLIVTDIENFEITTSKSRVISLPLKVRNDSSVIMMSSCRDFSQYGLHNISVWLFICACTVDLLPLDEFFTTNRNRNAFYFVVFNAYSLAHVSEIPTDKVVRGSASEIAAWVEFLCLCRARPPFVVVMLSETAVQFSERISERAQDTGASASVCG